MKDIDAFLDGSHRERFTLQRVPCTDCEPDDGKPANGVFRTVARVGRSMSPVSAGSARLSQSEEVVLDHETSEIQLDLREVMRDAVFEGEERLDEWARANAGGRFDYEDAVLDVLSEPVWV